MISVVVPAHNEEEHIAACLRALQTAARCQRLKAEAVQIIVVLDACTDHTEGIAKDLGATTLAFNGRNVGAARALGARFALAHGARWLAFTDADSRVSPGWLAAQLALASDAVCGTIAVDDWQTYGERMRRHFESTYVDADGHRHVHGANLGVSARAYCAVGGFLPLACSEDVALVDALRHSGAKIAWSAAPRVVTSARASFRAAGGFGDTLRRVEQACAWARPHEAV